MFTVALLFSLGLAMALPSPAQQPLLAPAKEEPNCYFACPATQNEQFSLTAGPIWLSSFSVECEYNVPHELAGRDGPYKRSSCYYRTTDGTLLSDDEWCTITQAPVAGCNDYLDVDEYFRI